MEKKPFNKPKIVKIKPNSNWKIKNHKQQNTSMRYLKYKLKLSGFRKQ